MIRADFFRDGDYLRLTIKGHAGYSCKGGDIVCASVSGIFYALAGYLTNICKERTKINAIESGYADIRCHKDCEEAMKLACIGLIQIELSYPGYIIVDNRIWNWRIADIA